MTEKLFIFTEDWSFTDLDRDDTKYIFQAILETAIRYGGDITITDDSGTSRTYHISKGRLVT